MRDDGELDFCLFLSWPQTGAYVRGICWKRPGRKAGLAALPSLMLRALSALHVIAVVLRTENDVGSKKRRWALE